MEPTQVIIKPLITEKSAWEAEARNRYSFQISTRANKNQVRDAIESIYKVRVVGVATQTRPGRYKKTRWGTVKTSSWKRAIVKLAQDDRIDLF